MRTERLVFALWLILASMVAASQAAAPSARTVDVYLFWRAGCPHCEKEVAFLDALTRSNPAVRVHRFDVIANPAHRALLKSVGYALQADVSAVPFTVIGDAVFVGYANDVSTGRELAARVEACLAQDCPDSVKRPLQSPAKYEPSSITPATGRLPSDGPQAVVIPETLRIPLVGDVQTAALSLPALTVVLAAVDGFNPCAMWVLVFLLGLLAGLKDRRRMWVLGGTFVAASAMIYFLFLAAWLNVLIFLGSLTFIRVAIGCVALAGGGYCLREFVRNRTTRISCSMFWSSWPMTLPYSPPLW